MEELFTILSSSARLDKSKRKPKRRREEDRPSTGRLVNDDGDPQNCNDDNDEDDHEQHYHHEQQTSTLAGTASRDRTGKRDDSDAKRRQVHQEQMAAFRRSMAIRITNRDDQRLPDAISSFDDMEAPSWWRTNDNNRNDCDDDDGNSNTKNEYNNDQRENFFVSLTKAILRNVEAGKWKEPTPIQMQAIPTLMERRDFIGAAPTGSGKSGAFILPALLLSGAPYHIFYKSSSDVHQKGTDDRNDDKGNSSSNMNSQATNHNNKKKKKKNRMRRNEASRQGEIRSLLLAPSRELAAQLHREVERLGNGKPGGISSLLLAKCNAAHVIAGTAGGKSGLDVMISTPLRLVDAIDKGLRLDSLRLVVLDEADRLLDAADGKAAVRQKDDRTDKHGGNDDDSSDDDERAGVQSSSGSNQTQTFLAQMDRILSCIPVTAVRALFSATVTPTVKSLAENILRDPVDVKIAAAGSMGGANTDIEQELMFVGREEGKLLAMRQLKQRGQLKPPAIVFVQSQERAQALFEELLYDGMHVDVIHAGRSKTARDNAVSKFRKGETWVLICTDLVARGVDFRAVNMVINYDLPTSGITYVHRIGRTGRAGRKGKAITLFTEADFDNLRTIANVMKQSGCQVEDWMLQLKKSSKKVPTPRRGYIDTTPRYDKQKLRRKKQIIQESKRKKMREARNKEE